jgi:hypothetical protein
MPPTPKRLHFSFLRSHLYNICVQRFWQGVDYFLRTLLWGLAGALLLSIYTKRFTWEEAAGAFILAKMGASALSGLQHVPAAIRWTVERWRLLLFSVLALVAVFNGLAWALSLAYGSERKGYGVALFIFMAVGFLVYSRYVQHRHSHSG